MDRVYSLDTSPSVPDGLGPDELDRSVFEADTIPLDEAQDAASRLGVTIYVLDHTEDVDPTCANGWCKAPVVAEARPLT